MPDKPATAASIPVPALAAGLIVPGLGQFVQGRRGHAALFSVCVLGLFVSGLAISGMTAIDREGHPVYWFMHMACGAPAWAVWFGGFAEEPLIGENVGVGEQMIGITYLAIAGIINLLALIDVVRHAGAAPAAAVNAAKGAAT